MADQRSNELFEIYSLHADLADRVSQRRQGANSIYISLLLALQVVLASLLGLDSGDGQDGILFCLFGVVGALLSVSWYCVVRSYQQLNSGKFKALRELEKELAFQFLDREWKLLGRGKDRSRYWKLSSVERFVPYAFLLLSVVELSLGAMSLVGGL